MMIKNITFMLIIVFSLRILVVSHHDFNSMLKKTMKKVCNEDKFEPYFNGAFLTKG